MAAGNLWCPPPKVTSTKLPTVDRGRLVVSADRFDKPVPHTSPAYLDLGEQVRRFDSGQLLSMDNEGLGISVETDRLDNPSLLQVQQI